MAKTAKAAWGIDVGNSTFKALKLGLGPDGVEVQDFVVYEHDQIISQSQLEPQLRTELVNRALNRFLQERDVRDAAVVVSVPGQNSFARFIKLPPVDSKRIPELVHFEAIQQIPFDIDEVEWDWQTFQSPGSPETEVCPLPGHEISAKEHVDAMAAAVPRPMSEVANLDTSLQRGLTFYYGLLDAGLAFLMVFKQSDAFRLAYSPCGGGQQPAWSPAWDYVLRVPDAQAGRTYTWDLCLVVKPFEGRQDILDEVRRYLDRG